jgi:hypothetical protein
VAAEVNHHGNVDFSSGRHRAGDRIPFRPGVVSDLYPDDQIPILPDAHRGQLRIHVGQILLDRTALHAGPDDIEKREHARFGTVDDLLLELRKVSPPRPAGIDQRGLAASERVIIRLHGAVAVAVGSVRLRAPEDVRMDVDEAGRHVKAARVHHLAGARRRDVGCDLRNLAASHRHVKSSVDPVLRIDHVAVLDQEIEFRVLGV